MIKKAICDLSILKNDILRIDKALKNTNDMLIDRDKMIVVQEDVIIKKEELIISMKNLCQSGTQEKIRI